MTVTSDEPRIYVACLASYNSGTLHGRWIDDCTGADEIRDLVDGMLRDSKYPNVEVTCLACDGDGCSECGHTGKVPSAEEWAIHDHEGFPPGLIEESTSFDTVAAIASALEEIDDREAFESWLGLGVHNEDDPSSWEEAFREAYAGEWDSKADWAEEYMDSTGGLADMPENLRNYFDFDAFARDCEMGGDMTFIREGGTTYAFNNH